MIRPYFMVSESDGNMYDTRKPEWWTKPLRVDYAWLHRKIENTIQLRAVIRTKYTHLGGYELFGIASDGGILCCDCMRKEYRQISNAIRHELDDGWRVVGVDSTCNVDEHTACDHCWKVIVDEGEGDEIPPIDYSYIAAKIKEHDVKIVRIPDALTMVNGGEIALTNVVDELTDVSTNPVWWRHIEASGCDLGIYLDTTGNYWVLEYDPARDPGGERCRLVFVGDTPDDVKSHLHIDEGDENDD